MFAKAQEFVASRRAAATGAVAAEDAAPLVDERPLVDRTLLMAEIFGSLMGLLGLILLFCGIGFNTVDPPGEADLCRVETLGLQNRTETERDTALKACHGLYTGVFSICTAMSIPYFLVAALALAASFTVCSGVCARNDHRTPQCFCYALCADVLGALLAWIPSMVYPGVAAVVTAAMAPIYAYWIAITVGHVAMQAANYTSSDGHVRDSAYVVDVLYKGYIAGYKVDMCLTVGSIALGGLFVLFFLDAGRCICSALNPPKYERCHQGSQTFEAVRRCRERYRGDDADNAVE